VHVWVGQQLQLNDFHASVALKLQFSLFFGLAEKEQNHQEQLGKKQQAQARKIGKEMRCRAALLVLGWKWCGLGGGAFD